MSMSAVGVFLPSAGMDDSAAAVPATAALGVQAARGTAAALFSQLIVAAIYAATSLILARLLSPEDFGLFAIAFAVVGVLEIAQRGGLTLPLVQARTLTDQQLAALFWFCAAVGAAQVIVAWLAAPLVSWVYADARIAAPIAVLALGFVATSVSTTEEAMIRRTMRFSRLAVFEVSSVAGAALVAIVSAWLGAGYWSLVYLQVARQFLFAGMLLAVGGVPRGRPRRAEIAPLVRFGRVMVAFEAVAFANSKIDNLIVGWFAGPAALGFYAKAFEFIGLASNQVNQPIGNVVHATLSRLQDEPRRYQTSLLNGVLLSTTVSAPLIIFIAAHAPLLFVVVFGQKWLASAAIFRLLAPGALVMAMSAAVGWIFVSLGRAERQLPWALLTSIITVIAFVVGARWGAPGVATAFSVSRVAFFIPTLMFTCVRTPVPWTSILKILSRPVAAGAVAALASISVVGGNATGAWSLALAASAFAASYVVSWIALPGGLALVRQQIEFASRVYRHA
jgi:O-antigen/teichoic acid export membrane protein